MFFQRLITTLILVPLVLLLLFYGPLWLLGAVVGLIGLLATKESWQLIPLTGWVARLAYLTLMAIGFGACSYFFSYWLGLGLVFWIGIVAAILSFPQSQNYWGHRFIVGSACLIVLPLFLQGLIHIYTLPDGKRLFVYLLCLIWAMDIGAYLIGKQIGKHKLIPQVSPGKSWEGVLGGLALSLLVAAVGCLLFKPENTWLWLGFAAITVIMSIFGDLFISILKRRCHLKDTGTLIPGHGGILDRLDSLIAALPLFYFGLTHLFWA